MLSDALTFAHGARLIDLAAKHKLPTVHTQSGWVEAGGLMSYGPSLPDLSRRAATYVDEILKGARPAELPVEQPTKFELVINLKTARAFGLTIPQTLRLQAARAIEPPPLHKRAAIERLAQADPLRQAAADSASGTYTGTSPSDAKVSREGAAA